METSEADRNPRTPQEGRNTDLELVKGRYFVLVMKWWLPIVGGSSMLSAVMAYHMPPMTRLHMMGRGLLSSSSSLSSLPVALWEFTRPHTLWGTVTSILGIHLYFVRKWSPRLVDSFWIALLPSMMINLYITGLNQITDIEIDRINKPYLPLAKGSLSKEQGIVVIIGALFTGLAMGYYHPFSTVPLLMTLIGSAVLGTMYSMQPFRLKRFPLLAAVCILVVRGSIINVGFFAHVMTAVYDYSSSPIWKFPLHFPSCLCLTLYFAMFGVCIALMKDIPDIKGDIIYKIRSFSVRLGAKPMFQLSCRVLHVLLASTSIGLGIVSIMAFREGNTWRGIGRGVVSVLAMVTNWFSWKKAQGVNADEEKEWRKIDCRLYHDVVRRILIVDPYSCFPMLVSRMKCIAERQGQGNNHKDGNLYEMLRDKREGSVGDDTEKGSLRKSRSLVAIVPMHSSSWCILCLGFILVQSYNCPCITRRGFILTTTTFVGISNDIGASSAITTTPSTDLSDILRKDYEERRYMITGDLSRDIYEPDCQFKDPTTNVKGVDNYIKATMVLFDPSASSLELLRLRRLSETQYETEWRLSGVASVETSIPMETVCIAFPWYYSVHCEPNNEQDHDA